MLQDTMDARRPPAVVRLAADVVDGALALAVVLVAQVATRWGLLGSPEVVTEGPLVFDRAALAWTLLLVALRDVPAGASVAKWLLGLRVVGRDGQRLALPLRILRAPLAIPPVEWFVEASGRWPWRVERYMPSGTGLAIRAGLALLAAGWTGWWGVQSLRPSVGGRDAERLARTILQGDPMLSRFLGPPLEVEVGRIAPRSQAFLEPDTGEFELRITGAIRRQDMRVRARRVDGHWAVDEIVDIEIAATAGQARDTLAVR